jgi:hypothetical protein
MTSAKHSSRQLRTAGNHRCQLWRPWMMSSGASRTATTLRLRELPFPILEEVIFDGVAGRPSITPELCGSKNRRVRWQCATHRRRPGFP